MQYNLLSSRMSSFQSRRLQGIKDTISIHLSVRFSTLTIYSRQYYTTQVL